MHKYVMIGPQGSGKGTQAKLLAREFGFVHISIGEVFRWHVRQHTKLGSRISRITQEGRLVSDEIVERVVRDRLELHDWRYGFILDGFPRTLAQADYLFENWNLDLAIYLDLDDRTVHERVLGRALQGQGSPLAARDDDTPAALQRRLADYHEKTSPLLEVFEQRGMLLRIDGSRTIAQVHEAIKAGLGLGAETAGRGPLQAETAPPEPWDRDIESRAASLTGF